MVKQILTKLKMKTTRILAVALAAVILLLNINIVPVKAAAAAPAISELAPILIGALGAGGISFASETDAANFTSEIFNIQGDNFLGINDYFAPKNFETMIEDSYYDEYGEFIGNYVTPVINDAGDLMYDMGTMYADGASRLFEISMSKVEGLLDSIVKNLYDYYNPAKAEGEAVTFSNENIAGYFEGEPVKILDFTGAQKYRGFAYQYYDCVAVPQFHNATFVSSGYVTKTFHVNGYTDRCEIRLISYLEIESKPFTATVNPSNNLMTDTPAAVAAIAALGGISAKAPGTYTDDDVIGFAIPVAGNTSALTNVKPEDIVIDMFKVREFPQVTTKPDVDTDPTTKPSASPSPSPSPSPTPSPVKIPSIPSILDALKNVLENINQAKQTTQNTAVDDGALDSALNDAFEDMTNLQNQLNNISQDDPNLLPQLEDAKNTITDLQNKIAEQEQAIKTTPEKYPDPAILEELQDLQNELEELKKNIQTDPGTDPNPTEAPGTSPDYTNLLERIIALLTSIKEEVSAIPETFSEVVIGSGELKPPGRGGAGDKDDDDDDDFDWSSIFPFCIPFDLVKSFENFVGTPAPPRFEVEIMGYIWVMDFAEYDYVAEIIRNGLMFSFMIWLMVMTGRVIKWL